MKTRPIAVTVVSWLMVAAGVLGIVYGFKNAGRIWPPEQDLYWIVLVDGLGIALGIFMLRGKNWARWLTVAWIGGHAAAVSYFMRRDTLAHLVIFALIAYLLVFRTDVREYFRAGSAKAPERAI